MRTFAFVFARGGSKGLPRKNIRQLRGVPLVGHAINLAKQLDSVEEIFVSTDSSEIREVAESLNATVIQRPKRLAQDTSAEWAAWQHGIEWVRRHYGDFDVFLSLPATSPLRNLSDVKNCLNSLDSSTDFVVTMTPAKRTPWFNMVGPTDGGFVELLSGVNTQIVRRQDAPTVYDLTTVAYVARPNFVLLNSGIWTGKVRGVVIPPERAIDIDTELDFRIAEFVWEMGAEFESNG